MNAHISDTIPHFTIPAYGTTILGEHNKKETITCNCMKANKFVVTHNDAEETDLLKYIQLLEDRIEKLEEALQPILIEREAKEDWAERVKEQSKPTELLCEHEYKPVDHKNYYPYTIAAKCIKCRESHF